MDHLETMRVFVAVAETQSFAAAARTLKLSAPAATRAVAALEERLGARLLHRTTRSVRVTDAGERYLADCKRILLDLDEADALAGGSYAEPQGQLAVTAPVLFGRLHVAPLMLDFLPMHPKVSARLMFVDRIVHLLDEGFDVAVRIAHLPDSSLTAVRVGQVRRVVVASPAYLDQHGEPRTPHDLADHQAVTVDRPNGGPAAWRFVLRREATAHPQEAQLEDVKPPRSTLSVNSAELGIAAARAGHGLSRALSYQVADDIAAGRLRVVLADHEAPPIPVQLVYPDGRRAAAKVRTFIDFAVQRLRANPVLNPDLHPIIKA